MVGFQIEHDSSEATTAAPEELLEATIGAIQQSIAEDLLDRIGRLPPLFFERLVVELLVAMGYGGSYAEAATVVGRSGDEGIDGIIKEDRTYIVPRVDLDFFETE